VYAGKKVGGRTPAPALCSVRAEKKTTTREGGKRGNKHKGWCGSSPQKGKPSYPPFSGGIAGALVITLSTAKKKGEKDSENKDGGKKKRKKDPKLSKRRNTTVCPFVPQASRAI